MDSGLTLVIPLKALVIESVVCQILRCIHGHKIPGTLKFPRMAADSGHVNLTIGQQNVTTEDVTKGESVDLFHRDPETLHDDMKIQFHDVFGEPDDSVHSFDCVWTNAFRLFTNTKLWCYRITSLICGLPLAIYWGIHFALISFCAIWCCEPYMKAYAIELSCIRRIYETMLSAFWRPCFETCGYVFYNIRIQKVSA